MLTSSTGPLAAEQREQNNIIMSLRERRRTDQQQQQQQQPAAGSANGASPSHAYSGYAGYGAGYSSPNQAAASPQYAQQQRSSSSSSMLPSRPMASSRLITADIPILARQASALVPAPPAAGATTVRTGATPRQQHREMNPRTGRTRTSAVHNRDQRPARACGGKSR